jgi:hypothetical protein
MSAASECGSTETSLQRISPPPQGSEAVNMTASTSWLRALTIRSGFVDLQYFTSRWFRAAGAAVVSDSLQHQFTVGNRLANSKAWLEQIEAIQFVTSSMLYTTGRFCLHTAIMYQNMMLDTGYACRDVRLPVLQQEVL